MMEFGNIFGWIVLVLLFGYIIYYYEEGVFHKIRELKKKEIKRFSACKVKVDLTKIPYHQLCKTKTYFCHPRTVFNALFISGCSILLNLFSSHSVPRAHVRCKDRIAFR